MAQHRQVINLNDFSSTSPEYNAAYSAYTSNKEKSQNKFLFDLKKEIFEKLEKMEEDIILEIKKGR